MRPWLVPFSFTPPGRPAAFLVRFDAMPNYRVQGQMIELPERDYFEQLIGLAYSTCLIANLFGTLHFVEGVDQSHWIVHENHLAVNIESIKDDELRESFLLLHDQFARIQSLNDRVIEALAAKTELAKPDSSESYQMLLDKLDSQFGYNSFPSILMDSDIQPVFNKALQIANEMAQTKIQIVQHILHFHPVLIDSEYIYNRDRPLFKLK